MKYYRLIEKTHEKSPLGYGRSGGRWNYKGTPLIYAASSSALCLLELLTIKGSAVATTKWVLITLDIFDSIPYLHPSDLPKNWANRPYPASTQRFGTNWAREMTTPYLKVPSCRIPITSFPAEHNLLVNPMHPEFTSGLRIETIDDFTYSLNH